MNEVGTDGDSRVLSEDFVLKEEDLVWHAQQGEHLRIEACQTGHHCGGGATSLILDNSFTTTSSFSTMMVRWLRKKRLNDLTLLSK